MKTSTSPIRRNQLGFTSSANGTFTAVSQSGQFVAPGGTFVPQKSQRTGLAGGTSSAPSASSAHCVLMTTLFLFTGLALAVRETGLEARAAAMAAF